MYESIKFLCHKILRMLTVCMVNVSQPSLVEGFHTQHHWRMCLGVVGGVVAPVTTVMSVMERTCASLQRGERLNPPEILRGWCVTL